jgi:hypothetical protein
MEKSVPVFWWGFLLRKLFSDAGCELGFLKIAIFATTPESLKIGVLYKKRQRPFPAMGDFWERKTKVPKRVVWILERQRRCRWR